MKAVRPGPAMIALCALLSACGNPSGPSKRSYEGQWTGTTAQGKTVTFTISADENVTAIMDTTSTAAREHRRSPA